MPAVKWTYNIELIKQYHSIFLKYVDFWKEKFGDTLITIEYEDLVKNTEQVSKKITDFCELQWEPSLLNYHKENIFYLAIYTILMYFMPYNFFAH